MPRIPYQKPSLTYSEQLQQLKDRGLIIENEIKALHLLENLSYYRLSAYWYPMLETPKNAHRFKIDSSFNKAFKLYCFDREFRKLISLEIEKIEVSIRAKMIYILSHSNGPFWYSNANLFINSEKLSITLKKLRSEKNRSDEEFIKAFNKNYSNTLPPSWMILEISSLGTLSSLYKNLKPKRAKRNVANYYGLDVSTFESWLHTLTYVRNICAHHSRLWNKRMSIQPQIPLTPSNKFINIHQLPNPNQSGKTWRINDRSYFILTMILYLSNTIHPKHKFKEKLNTLFIKYPFVDKKALGFPENWQDEPIWV
ncbi:Abi family protein [Polaribacter batillariae]|uniref:Abi family protein n=1 Tax=Polaribacter batillariae TaxID=2808900 RepID=A0ABX7STH6_9FLAO|nr:Abi family protein [Polaribacter batillariae]QTD36256.1 Abi family protein [Polaribacter batillariae]